VDISLELIALDQPYIKTWEIIPAELEQYRHYLGEGLSLGAFEGDRVVGLAITEPRRWHNSLWVWEFGIDLDYRREGIGRHLMEALAEKAQAAGFRSLVCEVQNTNMPAIRFYRAVGFQVEGIDLSYYTNDDLEQSEVAIFMKRKLAPSNG
jgi:ribosomal protein S18 acetylase RimI-like enzyme